MNETKYHRRMSLKERDSLKAFASNGKCLADALEMIAHWMRVHQEVTFTDYAANWCEAHRARSIEPMREQWPFAGARCIADNHSDWVNNHPAA